MHRLALSTLVLLGLALGNAPGATVTFTAKPEAVAQVGEVKITFELSSATDVAVGIVNVGHTHPRDQAIQIGKNILGFLIALMNIPFRRAND